MLKRNLTKLFIVLIFALSAHTSYAAIGPQMGGENATLSSVVSSATSVTLEPKNLGRLGLYIFNDSTAILYVKFGSTASSSSYTVQIAAGGYYEAKSPAYRGIVTGIWASANGNARMTEVY